MRRSAKVATPATAFTLRVPDNGPPPGFAPRATVIAPVKPGTTLPRSEERRAGKAGVTTRPAYLALGCWVNWSWVAGGGVMVNEALGASGSPPAMARSV